MRPRGPRPSADSPAGADQTNPIHQHQRSLGLLCFWLCVANASQTDRNPMPEFSAAIETLACFRVEMSPNRRPDRRVVLLDGEDPVCPTQFVCSNSDPNCFWVDVGMHDGSGAAVSVSLSLPLSTSCVIVDLVVIRLARKPADKHLRS